jgi:hypothetical protein
MTVQFDNGGTIEYVLQPNWQRPTATFRPLAGVDVEPGRYAYLRHNLTIQTDPSAKLAVRVEPSAGGYFNGRLRSLRTLLQVTPDPRVAVAADYTVNRIDGVGASRASLTTHLMGLEARLAASPRFQFVSFTQWNSAGRQVALNARVAWEYQPLSYLTVIYNHRSPLSGRDFNVAAPPASRQLLVKATWLLQL